MSEKDRNKAGLHKKISSIFDGVVVPQSDDEQNPSGNAENQETEYTGSIKHILETQVSEPSKSNQPSQTSPQDKPAPQSQNESSNQSDFGAVQGSQEVSKESEIEPAQSSYEQPTSSTDFLTEQHSDELPVEESETESVMQSDGKSTASPNFLTADDSIENPVEPSESKSSRQTSEKPASPPKFLTAQDSKGAPVEKSNVDNPEKSDEKKARSKAFITSKGAKVIPIEESDVEHPEELGAIAAQQSSAEPAKQANLESADQDETSDNKKQKVTPVKQSKAAEKKTKLKISELKIWNQISAKLFTTKSGESPAKQKVMVIMIPVLFIFLIVFVLKGGVFGSRKNNAAADGNNADNAASAVLNTQIEWKIPDPYPVTLRDPTLLGPAEEEFEQEGYGRFARLKVKAILISEDGSSSVVIGNRILHEGERIKGVNIIKINKDNVEFEVNGEKWTQEVQG